MKDISYTIITCGTGGHVLPALTILEAGLKNQLTMALIMDSKTAIIYKARIEKYKEEYKDMFYVIYTKPFYIDWKMPLVLIQNIWKVKNILLNTKLSIGFVAGLQIPTLFAAVLLRRKFILHEQDSVLNKTNRIFKRFACKINSSFKELVNYKKNTWIGCPMDLEIIKKENNIQNKSKKILTILGGTNGSNLFDQYLPQLLIKIADYEPLIKEYVIYHNCRRENEKNLIEVYKNSNLHVTVSPYFFNFEDLIKNSSFLITRGGASTISYLNLYEKNSIVIPWKESAQEHQKYNGKSMKDIYGAIVINEEELEEKLEKNIIYLLHNYEKIQMGKNIKNIFKIINGKEYLEKCV